MSESYHPTADRLEAFVEGGLPPAERVVLESHLVGCPTCHTAVEEWRALFAVLATLPQFDPRPGFTDRVMVRVRVAPRSAWQEWTATAGALVGRAGQLAARAAPATNYGWTLATVLLALPVLLGGGLVAWLLNRTSVAPGTLWSWAGASLVEGLQGVGATVISTIMTTDIAAWIAANMIAFVGTAGVTGIGVLIATAGISTMLSVWVLYRNLFRTPRRESRYALYSI